MKDGYLGDTFDPSMVDEKVFKMKLSCPKCGMKGSVVLIPTGIALLGWVLNNYTCATTLPLFGLGSMFVVCLL